MNTLVAPLRSNGRWTSTSFSYRISPSRRIPTASSSNETCGTILRDTSRGVPRIPVFGLVGSRGPGLVGVEGKESRNSGTEIGRPRFMIEGESWGIIGLLSTSGLGDNGIGVDGFDRPRKDFIGLYGVFGAVGGMMDLGRTREVGALRRRALRP